MEGLELALFSPDGSVIVSAGGGGEVVIWDAQCDTLQRALDCKEDGICRCTWSPDSTKVQIFAASFLSQPAWLRVYPCLV